MDELLANIANIGFPIALSAYLLVRLEGQMKELNLSIINLTKAVEDISPKKD